MKKNYLENKKKKNYHKENKVINSQIKENEIFIINNLLNIKAIGDLMMIINLF